MLHRIESRDDPRIAAYRNLPDRTLRGESIFLAEGRLLTRRLLASGFEVDSVFVTDEYLDEFLPLAADRAPVYVAEEKLLLEVVGFKFHRGAMAVGRRGQTRRLEQLLAPHEPPGRLRLVICPEITKPENMGLIFRTASALGLDGVLLGERCCDPFSRRSMRVSMGAVLQVPFVKTTNLLADLRLLKERWSVELAAAVVDPAAEDVSRVAWPNRTGVLFGNEFDGLGPYWLALADRRVTIPIRAAVDSLNLGVAAGIVLYELAKAPDVSDAIRRP